MIRRMILTRLASHGIVRANRLEPGCGIPEGIVNLTSSKRSKPQDTVLRKNLVFNILWLCQVAVR